MLDLFADAEPWQEPLASGAVILRRFAFREAPLAFFVGEVLGPAALPARRAPGDAGSATFRMGRVT